jgi:hypothetical protein
MKNTQTQNRPAATDSDSTWSDAGKLSRKVRELADRSYRLLKTSPRTEGPVQAGPEDAAADHQDLRDQIDHLHRKIHERRLSALIPWIDALHRQVQDRLDVARKAGAR